MGVLIGIPLIGAAALFAAGWIAETLFAAHAVGSAISETGAAMAIGAVFGGVYWLSARLAVPSAFRQPERPIHSE